MWHIIIPIGTFVVGYIVHSVVYVYLVEEHVINRNIADFITKSEHIEAVDKGILLAELGGVENKVLHDIKKEK